MKYYLKKHFPVKIVVLGEAGVGKTSLIQSILGRSGRGPGWTVGCSVDVLVHWFNAGRPDEAGHLIELWDVGGSRNHRNSRHIFYTGTQGVILVHDLSNRKSEETLRGWLDELFGNAQNGLFQPSSVRLPSTTFDGPKFHLIDGDRANLPILLVGSKADLSPERDRSKLAVELGTDELSLDCRLPISPGSTNGLKVSRFLDRVIDIRTGLERKKQNRDERSTERRRRLW